jgi:hypothetical protein
MSLITECTVSFYLYILMTLTNFMGEVSIREYSALALVFAIALIVLMNLIILGKKCLSFLKVWI